MKGYGVDVDRIGDCPSLDPLPVINIDVPQVPLFRRIGSRYVEFPVCLKERPEHLIINAKILGE